MFIIPSKIFKKVQNITLVDPKLDTPEQERELILQAFKKFDLDQSGALDVLEFQSLAKKLGFVMTVEEASDYVCEIDEDKNGLIDFEEFYNWFTSETSQLNSHGQDKKKELMIQLHKELRNYSVNRWMNFILEGGRANSDSDELYQMATPGAKKEQARKMFNMYDTDKNGYLDLEEFQDMASKLGVKLTKKQAKKELDKIDLNGDGVLSFEEFFGWWSDDRKKKDGFYDRIKQGAANEGGKVIVGRNIKSSQVFGKGDIKKSGNKMMNRSSGGSGGSSYIKYQSTLPPKVGHLKIKQEHVLSLASQNTSLVLIDYMDALIQNQYKESGKEISKFKYGLEEELQDLRETILSLQRIDLFPPSTIQESLSLSEKGRDSSSSSNDDDDDDDQLIPEKEKKLEKNKKVKKTEKRANSEAPLIEEEKKKKSKE